ncbi:AAA family ATPase [Pseudoalteromonas sp. B530]|uniref:AAA family ATPase n=1 Tax=Pseudoalteromonas sp. B530 TaxID=2994390 RepID=UPI00224AEEFE|nr:AAA family ATPase [Pseudoalteromonas sp. B530]MCX2767117.1 AAA family ATPase [Pseudoalteromonas sp. B530]
MKEAALKDGWRRIGEVTKYPLKIESVEFEGVAGFSDKFSIDFKDGLTCVCGKNGVGKSTLLKLIYESLTGTLKSTKVSVNSKINILVTKGDKPIDINTFGDNKLYYLDPSYECSKIINFIESTKNFDEFLEGIEPNGFLNRPKKIRSVSSCIGKPYKNIKIYEIENALDDEYSFPFFEIELQDGSFYNSLNMGMGEHLCMFLLWYVEWIEEGSILLLEELENYLAAYSQTKILDHLAYKLSEKRIWTIITTHSEHILNKVGNSNTRILYRRGTSSLSVKPEDSDKYLKALGLKLNKKGVYLVEDYFASLKFKTIINFLRPELLESREVIGLRCDSNLEKMIKHYEPSPKPFFDLMAVFDADQGEKIPVLVRNEVNAICLPSEKNLNPEEEIWCTLKAQPELIAEAISIQVERLEEVVAEFELDDHHDRYYKIADALGVTFENLVAGIIKVWVSEGPNLLLAHKFILALGIRNSRISKSSLIKKVNKIESPDLKMYIENRLKEIAENEVFVFFNGTDLIIDTNPK